MNWRFWRKKNTKKTKKSTGREWADAIIFAVIAATLIRTLFIEAYTIPTPSMERSLLVGDFLFVSKVNYGARTPMTPLAFPFAHHTMPLTTDVKAYSEAIKLPYYRLPGFQDVKKGDVVVFNYPMDADSPYYRPVDKRENYIKRCQGAPGDTLSVVDAQVFINGKAAENPPEGQIDYVVTTTDGGQYNPQILQELHISDYNNDGHLTMTAASAKTLRTYPGIKSVTPTIAPKGLVEPYYSLFPNNSNFPWNADNYGPIIIPKKGWTVKLDSTTIPIYQRAIGVYENNKVQVNGNEIIINGKKADSYTFKMDYYWMMGDNRHDSADSRYWGFVPEDHIVGKALFVWMSWDSEGSFLNKIRWSRLFRGVN